MLQLFGELQKVARMMNELPILYSFRRCPYAIRARMAIAASQRQVQLREIELKNKAVEFLEASPKATVPVLIGNDGLLLEESLDIMHWALRYNDPQTLLVGDMNLDDEQLISYNDSEFKHWLDRYKYADRFPEQSKDYYRKQCETFLAELETRLASSEYLRSAEISALDIAIFPFIRQFAFTDKRWFDQSPYPRLKNWLGYLLDHNLFLSVMQKVPAWQPSDSIVVFPAS